MKKHATYLLLFIMTCNHATFCRENKGSAQQKQKVQTIIGCPNTTAQTDLSVNNVRARILNGGDLWWDYNNNSTGIYEVPIGSGKNSIYAGSIWIGGYDMVGNLKMAAQTYRQTGANDFWSGPIAKNGSGVLDVSTVTCSAYDRFWKLNKAQVVNFASGGASTPDILSWPGNGNVSIGELPFLAPFHDINNNGLYEPLNGDYPNYDITNSSTTGCDQYLQGDQVIWWVFNDIGNTHTETNCLFPIGLEVRAQAFAYQSTNVAINNSTFYKYEIINRSNETLLNTYFGVWCDVDLGNPSDDYVGCDVGLGLGYCTNGNWNDAGANGYGINPPAIGIDFFRGPWADANDGIDNDRDGTTDEPNEQIIMSNFQYYENLNGIPTGNPMSTDDYYQYLSSTWLDGTHVTYGGDGKGSGPGATATPCNFMFPGMSDPAFSSNWTMSGTGLSPGDMRFLESAGKFTMSPGAINYVSTGVVWAQSIGGGPQGSLSLLIKADTIIQKLFNNCFVVTSVNEEIHSGTYSLFPNPSFNNSLLKFNNAEGNKMMLRIYDSRGKIVFLKKNIVTSEFLIESRLLQKGIYIFQLTGEKEVNASGKFTVL